MFNDSTPIERFLQNTIADHAVLVVGDIMLDRYYFGEVKRISPEAPVPVTRVTHEHSTLGGAANVANNLALLGAKVFLAGIVGQDESRRELERLLQAAGIEFSGLISDSRPTTTKLRVLGGHQQMMRLDFEDSRPVEGKNKKSSRIISEKCCKAEKYRRLLFQITQKGSVQSPLCSFLIKECAKLAVPLIVDPKGTNWKKYSGPR